MDDRLLILGHNGYVGSYLTDYFKSNIIYNDNICNTDNLIEFIKKNNIKYIVNAAAFTKLNLCEQNKERAFQVNVSAIKNMLKKLQTFSYYPKFIQISSDQIFDGTNFKEYIVDECPVPICYYSFTKAVSEEIVKCYQNGLIIRTSRIFGNRKSKKTNGIDFIFNQIKQNDKIEVFENMYQRPTHLYDIAKFIETALYNDYIGIWHVVGKDIMNRIDIANSICKLLNKKCKIIPIWTSFGYKDSSNNFYFILSSNSKNCIEGMSLEEGLHVNYI